MLKLALACLLMAAVCAAEPPRYRLVPHAARVRIAARQQVAAAPPAPAPTGYPAAGVTPEVPFDLPSATAKPDVSYLPPDNTYGPPDNTYGPPDSTYGAPPADDQVHTTAAPAIDVQPEAPPQPAVQNQPVDEVDEVDEEQEAEEEGDELFVAVDDEGSVIAVSSSFDQGGLDVAVGRAAPAPARLILARGAMPARIIKMRRIAPAKLQLLAPPQAQALRYNTRLQQW